MTRPAVTDIHARLQENFQRMEDLLKKLEANEDPRIQIAAAAEMRQHIALASKTLEIALRAEALRNFQNGVLEALANAGIVVRRKILCLFEARAEKDEQEMKSE
jgi:hypothetical protein